jgi:hypothetical protein
MKFTKVKETELHLQHLGNADHATIIQKHSSL